MRGRSRGVRSWRTRAVMFTLPYTFACVQPRTPEDPSCAGVQTLPGVRDGYVVEWTCRVRADLYRRACAPLSYEGPIFEHAVIRGTGHVRVGMALMAELRPYLDALPSRVGWTTSPCGRQPWYAVVVARLDEMDQAISIVGEYLRRRDAKDTVVFDLALRAAPAISGHDGVEY